MNTVCARDTEDIEVTTGLNTVTPKTRMSLMGLVRSLGNDTKTLIRQEIELVKTELSEKLSYVSKHAVSLAIGGFVAYAGLIVFLAGLGGLAAWGLAKSGLDPLLSAVIGLGGLGLIVLIVGTVLVLSALKRLKEESLAPERTLQTLQDFRGTEQSLTHQEEKSVTEDEMAKPSSEDLQARVEDTEYRMSYTLDQLGERLSPGQLTNRVRAKVRRNPYRAGAIAAGVGFVGAWVLRRKMRR